MRWLALLLFPALVSAHSLCADKFPQADPARVVTKTVYSLIWRYPENVTACSLYKGLPVVCPSTLRLRHIYKPESGKPDFVAVVIKFPDGIPADWSC